ncbi:MAG: metallophosphoesterase [Bacillota bacterium]
MKKRRILRLMIYLIVAAVFLFSAFYNGLVFRNYTVYSDRISLGNSIRIVLIADLHSHIYGENQIHIAERIRSQKPDIIALAGDIADDQVPIDGTKLFLEAVKGISPIYYVSGNHEVWTGELDSIKKLFRSYGAHVLENTYLRESIKGEEVVICGADDPDVQRYKGSDYNWEDELYKAFYSLGAEKGYKILLSHRPERVDAYKSLPFDLVLSGHSHGGQVRIPFLLNGLLAPHQGWFPKYAGGLYKHDEMTHVVSRGVSYNPRLPRIFNPPEIVVIDILGKKIN